jgi:hypothetical protein
MTRGFRALSVALAGVGLVGLGVSSPGSAQDTIRNQTGAIGAAPTASAPAATSSLAPVPPTAASAAVEPVSANSTADANAVTNAASDDDAAPPAPAAPLVRARYTTAVLQALDKVTAETLRFEAKVGEPVRYKDLVITVHACETSAANEPPKDSIVHMDVQYQPVVLSGGASVVRQVFRGWMFAQSPGLHPFANPIYDVWVIACKTPAVAPSAPASGANL